MTEKEWVSSIIPEIEKKLKSRNKNIRIIDGRKLTYASEIRSYLTNGTLNEQNNNVFETDILVYEQIEDAVWKPRVVIEAKLSSVTTHDAITYSQKAQAHKFVHPYLRYGIILGNRKHKPLPGRLFRHGQHFDFMLSWKSLKSEPHEMKTLVDIVVKEIVASKNLEEIIYNTRTKGRAKYSTLHKPLELSN
jgi:hypothetical protein